MAKIDFRGLVPGKRYKIVIHPETVYGTMKALPTIDFIVPEAPPRARGFRLDIRTRYKSVIVGYKNRKLRIYKWRVTQPGGTGKPKYVVIITGTGTFRKNKIKPGDKVTVNASGATSINVTGAKVLNRESTPKNRIRYLHPNQDASTTSWSTYTTDDNATVAQKPITHINGGAAIIEKIPYVRMRIPKAIFQNLMWNDTVRDFVHIVYRKGNSKKTITGPRKYLLTDTDVSRDTPIQDGTSGFYIGENELSVEEYPNGHPPVFVKEIRDKKFYQFEFIVARYTRTENTDGSYTSWSGSWIEQNTPFNKKLSKPAGWKA